MKICMGGKKVREVINRLDNCKFRSAYEFALELKDGIRPNVLKEFRQAAIDFENCGWGGKLINGRANRLAKLLGYVTSERTGFYVRKRIKK